MAERDGTERGKFLLRKVLIGKRESGLRLGEEPFSRQRDLTIYGVGEYTIHVLKSLCFSEVGLIRVAAWISPFALSGRQVKPSFRLLVELLVHPLRRRY